MPDHLHLVTQGLSANADLRRFVADFKQRSGFEHRRLVRTVLWQEGYHDRVLRSEDSVQRTVAYVLNNRVRARLVERAEDYAWLGSDRYPLNELLDSLGQSRG